MPPICQRLSRSVTKFSTSRSGSIAMMTGLMFPIIVMATGGAFDLSRATADRLAAQRILDSTVLSMATRQLTVSEIATEGPKAFKDQIAMKNAEVAVETADFTPVGAISTGAGVPEGISGLARIRTKAYFLSIIGMNDIPSMVRTTARKPEKVNHEIALVLDVSGSMNQNLGASTKIDQLEKAVSSMFLALEAQEATSNNLSVAVVPYSSSVNVGNVNSAALTAKSLKGAAAPAVGDDVWVAERFQSATATGFNLTDGNPLADPIPFMTQAETGGARPLSRFVPLTSNAATYKAATSGLTADGATAAHIGMAWGVYALSPNWGAIWPQDPAPYGEAKKYIVLMTDGSFNSVYNISRPGETGTEVSNAYFLSVCELASSKGIQIFAVALALDPASEALLEKCIATGSGKVFPAKDADGLRDAFEDIARKIGLIRITS